MSSSIRAYAWIQFAAATLSQTSMVKKAVDSADETLKHFDSRFTEDGEAVTPGLIEEVFGHVRHRLNALEAAPRETDAALAALSAEFETRFAGLREGVATDLNSLSARVDRLAEGEDTE